MTVRAANTIEQAAKMVTKEVDRESRRAAEPQGGTTITVGAVTPLAISTSLESGPESSAPYYRASTTFPPCERCLDYQIGSLAPRRWTTTIITALSAYFGYPQTWKAHLVVLRPHLPPQSLRPPPQSLCHLPPPPRLSPLPPPPPLPSPLSPSPPPPPPSLCHLPPPQSLCPLPPPQSLRSLPSQSLGAPSVYASPFLPRKK